MNFARLAVAAVVAILIAPPHVAAWNTPTHMVTGSIAYRILENESPRTVSIIKTLLEKHPWYADRWRDDIEKLPESQRGEMLFMLAARWADDIRMQAKLQREVKWHYINFPSRRNLVIDGICEISPGFALNFPPRFSVGIHVNLE